jgi:hypothetical protein
MRIVLTPKLQVTDYNNLGPHGSQLGRSFARIAQYRSTRSHHTMQNFLHSIWAAPAAIAIGCAVAFPIVALVEQDKQALVRCEQMGRSVTECRLLISGR